MKIVFLSTSRDDLKWMHDYYEYVFPEGAENYLSAYNNSLQSLKDFPRIGKKKGNKYIYPIPNTRFSFSYKIDGDFIKIHRVKDTRGKIENPQI